MELINDTNSFIKKSFKFDDNLFDNIDNNVNDIRTSINTYDSLQDTGINFEDSKNYNDKNDENTINIYRYKFTNEFTNELFKFSKVHQYDHRKDFKDAWKIWIEENENLVDGEVRRLSNLGYDGDILDKMFKSARYYFKKKSTEKKAPAKRRIYVVSQRDLLDSMYEHIKTSINSGDFKPSDGFDNFCKQNVDILKEQVTMLCRAGLTDSNKIKEKIKKTYNNRYFLLVSKLLKR